MKKLSYEQILSEKCFTRDYFSYYCRIYRYKTAGRLGCYIEGGLHGIWIPFDVMPALVCNTYDHLDNEHNILGNKLIIAGYNPKETISTHYKNGNLESKHFYLNGLLHRDDGPALIKYNKIGSIIEQKYYLNGSEVEKI